MSVTTAVEEWELEEMFDSIRQILRAERNRTATEIEAFEEIANTVSDLQASSNRPASRVDSGGLHEAGSASTIKTQPMPEWNASDKLNTIETVYKNTVMSLPFYEAEYGDTYEESIRAEFGPDAATALIKGNCFTPAIKQLLLAKLKQARAERKTLIETCERERESIDDAAAVLRPMGKELKSIESVDFDCQGFGALDADRTRLLTLKNKCEHVATSRQAQINHHRTEYNLPVDAPDICAYLYDEFNTVYPILYLCCDLDRTVKNLQQDVERAMSTEINVS